MSEIKKKKTNNTKYVVLIAISIVIMLLAIVVIVKLTKSSASKKDEGFIDNSSETAVEEVSVDDEIRSLSETRRMKRYIGIFLENIENGNYKEAYDVLNQDFKNTYFPTLDDFKKYADRYLNSYALGISYDNIERLANNKTGNMYVLWTTVTNVFQPKLEEGQKAIQTNFVIIEYDYNKYEMSFSVRDVEE